MLRMGSVVVAMEVAALAVAYLAFGWGVLLVGAPLLVGTVLLLAVVLVSERRRCARQELPVIRPEVHVAPSAGLMSGFFEIPAQAGPASLPETARAR